MNSLLLLLSWIRCSDSASTVKCESTTLGWVVFRQINQLFLSATREQGYVLE